MIACDKCGAVVLPSSKYCPQCGDPVTDEDTKVVAPVNKVPATVLITFGYSTSANYDTAIAICNNVQSYSKEGVGKYETHTVTLPINEVELILRIFDLVGSWSSSRMLIDGRSATKRDLTYHGVGCYRTRQKAFRPQQYCFGEKEYEFNVWGCKRLNMPIGSWGGGWLDYGAFDDRGVWHFDKDRIRHDLEIALQENMLCPVLDRRKVMQTLDKIPARIDPRKSKSWQYRTDYQEVNGDFKQVAVGVSPVLSSASTFVIGAYRPEWDQDSSNVKSLETRFVKSHEPQNSSELTNQNLKVHLDERLQKRSRATMRNVLFMIIIIVAILLVMSLLSTS